MRAPDDLVRGRDAYARRAWKDAFELLNAADHRAALDGADLHLLATAAFLTGHDADCDATMTRAFHAFVAHGDPVRAARTAFWLAFMHIHTGDAARAGGWTLTGQAPARRLRRRLRRAWISARAAGASAPHRRSRSPPHRPPSREAAAIGDRFGDADLASLARMGQGRALIRLGERARGTALLDEAMVAVTAGEVSSVIAGTVYCSVISACFERYDVGRAQEWTEALSRWCAAQPDLVPYRGECLVHRVEIKLLHGELAGRASGRAAGMRAARTARHRVPASAHYLIAETQSAAWPASPRPSRPIVSPAKPAARRSPGSRCCGWRKAALDAARAAIARVVGETREPRSSAPHCSPPHVDVLLASGDLAAARAAADELVVDRRCARHAVRPRRLGAGHGRVCLAAGDAQSRRSPRCVAHRRSGTRSTCRMRSGASTCTSASPAVRSAMSTAAGSNWRRHAASSRSSAPRPTSSDSRRCSHAPRSAHAATASRRASSRCCGSSPAARPIGASPPICASARRPWPATSATSSPSSTCRAEPRRPRTPSSTSWCAGRAYIEIPTAAPLALLHSSVDAERARALRIMPAMEIQNMHRNISCIGGGQAGLSVGYHLAQRGRPFLILDANQRIGDSWRQRWDSLRLFTPARWDGLDGMPFPAPPAVVSDQGRRWPTTSSRTPRTSSCRSERRCSVERLSRDGRRYIVADPRRGRSSPTTSSSRCPAIRRRAFRHSARAEPGDRPAALARLQESRTAARRRCAHRRRRKLRRRDRDGPRARDIASGWPAATPARSRSASTASRRGCFSMRLVFRVVFHRVLTVDTPLGRKARRWSSRRAAR